MATKGNMTLRIEPELKAQASELFKALGMDLSTATGIFFRQALRCHGLPFDVKLADPEDELFYSRSNVEHIKRGIKAFEKGDVTSHELLEDD